MRCYRCMNECQDGQELCPHCGTVFAQDMMEGSLYIKPGTMLDNRYYMGMAVGSGGFGITYIAWDTQLDMRVAIKEYLPSEFATRVSGQSNITVFGGDKTQQFRDGLVKYIDEAKRLVHFRNEKGIVNIYDSFEENGTAYIIMEYLEGETLASFLEREKTVPVGRAINMLMPVFESLAAVHASGIIHRDIAPDNVFITTSGDVKLIDFGAARYATTSHSRSLSVIIKSGYSPEEQYRSKGDQGPHTDVYAVAGVLYRMITGVVPPDAMERRAQYECYGKDILEPITKYTNNISANQETAILNAINIRIEDRSPDIVTFVGELMSVEPIKRRAGKIKKIDVLTLPMWLKVTVPTVFACVAVLIVLLVTGVINWENPETEITLPEGVVRVPSVLNYTYEEAKAVLESRELGVIISDSVYSADIEQDRILMQSPDVASKVSVGQQVSVTVSAGLESEFVPDVAGYTLELAQLELENLGFVVEVKEEQSDAAPGSVIAQSTAAGEKLALGETIILSISTGNEDIDEDVKVTVPNVVGMTYSQEMLMAKYCLYVQIGKTIHSDTIAKGKIIEQNPSAGTSLQQGKTVTVTVSAGVETVYVPGVQNFKLEVAQSTLDEKGLSYTVTQEESANVAAGTVISQSPSEGEEVKSGETVNLIVSSGYTVTVPSVVGKTYTNARTSLVNAGLSVKIVYKESSTIDEDKVISQKPASGTKVSADTQVTINVSTGAATTKAATTTTTKAVTVSKITITKPSNTTYYIGASKLSTTGMKVTAHYSDDSQKDVTGSSSTSGFDSSKAGSCTITVSYKEKETFTASFTVTIKSPSVSVSASSDTIKVNDQTYLSATTAPTSDSVTYSSSDTSVATVSSSGTVTGVKAGKAKMTATLKCNGKTYTAYCYITVESSEVAVTGVSLSKTSASCTVGNTVSLTASILPSNATNQDVTWSSSDTSVATVNSSGRVTGEAVGNVTIKATASGGATASCVVSVKPVAIHPEFEYVFTNLFDSIRYKNEKLFYRCLLPQEYFDLATDSGYTEDEFLDILIEEIAKDGDVVAFEDVFTDEEYNLLADASLYIVSKSSLPSSSLSAFENDCYADDVSVTAYQGYSVYVTFVLSDGTNSTEYFEVIRTGGGWVISFM